MNNDIEEIKNRLDIVDVVGSYVNLKKSGSNFKGLCPFHHEKSPSFMVNQERQIFKCFGCNEGGDIFEFVQKIESLTFPESLKMLADKAGYQLTTNDYRKNSNGISEPDTKSRLYKINLLCAEVFSRVLTTHPTGKKALEYLKKRGLTDETIKTFHIGFAPESTIVHDFLKKRGFTEKELQLAGSPQRFRGRIMFPIQDVLGNIIGFTGRSLDPNLQPKYFNTPETPLFYKSRVIYGLNQGRKALKDKNYAILLEGQMDVVLAHQVGIANAIASSGTALTKEHLKIIKRYTDNICLSFDMDGAGQKATLGALRLAQEESLTAKVAILPPPFKDAGEAILADPTVFKEAIRSAAYGMDWLIEDSIKNQGTLSITDKKLVAKQVLPFIVASTDPIEQAHWTGVLAKRLSVPIESINKAIDRMKNNPTSPKLRGAPQEKTAPTPSTPGSNWKLTPDELLYGLLLTEPDLKTKHEQLYTTLKQEYSGSQAELEAAVLEFKKTIGSESLETEVNTLIKRRDETTREQVKSNFASSIAEAEAKGDRAAVRELLTKLQQQIK